MGKQSGLYFIQRFELPAVFAQAHPFVPPAPFLQQPVHKPPKVVQVLFYKIAVVVFPNFANIILYGFSIGTYSYERLKNA